jgi:hypothetical protein
MVTDGALITSDGGVLSTVKAELGPAVGAEPAELLAEPPAILLINIVPFPVMPENVMVLVMRSVPVTAMLE